MQHDKSNLIAFFDYESTGVPLFKERSSDERQPHIVEGAVYVFTRAGELILSYNAYAKPDGWTSTPEALAKHGLTDEFLAEHGIPERNLIDAMVSMIKQAGTRVAHNRSFDDRMTRIALSRFYGEEAADAFKALEQDAEDTASLAKPVCKLPATEKMKATNFKNGFKTPTLEEAFFALTGKVLEGAHSASADAMACARVYFLLKGVRMQAFPDDADVLREGIQPLPHGKEECDAAQVDLVDAAEARQ